MAVPTPKHYKKFWKALHALRLDFQTGVNLLCGSLIDMGKKETSMQTWLRRRMQDLLDDMDYWYDGGGGKYAMGFVHTRDIRKTDRIRDFPATVEFWKWAYAQAEKVKDPSIDYANFSSTSERSVLVMRELTPEERRAADERLRAVEGLGKN